MIRTHLTVWRNQADGPDLLQQHNNGRYYIPLSFVTPATLAELGAAISDALTAATAPKQTSETSGVPAQPALIPIHTNN